MDSYILLESFLRYAISSLRGYKHALFKSSTLLTFAYVYKSWHGAIVRV